MFKKLPAVGLIVGILLLWAGCTSSNKNENQGGSLPGDPKPVDSIVIALQGQTGKSVLEITLQEHKVNYIESEIGVFVDAIDSLEVGSKYGWMYSVNNMMGQVASDKYITNDSDVVRWHYRKF